MNNARSGIEVSSLPELFLDQNPLAEIVSHSDAMLDIDQQTAALKLATADYSKKAEEISMEMNLVHAQLFSNGEKQEA